MKYESLSNHNRPNTVKEQIAPNVDLISTLNISVSTIILQPIQYAYLLNQDKSCPI